MKTAWKVMVVVTFFCAVTAILYSVWRDGYREGVHDHKVECVESLVGTWVPDKQGNVTFKFLPRSLTGGTGGSCIIVGRD